MKIVLATYGSRGDVQPMLALSLAFKSLGHEVVLAGPPEKEDWAHQLGCPFHPLGSDLTTFIDSMHNVYSMSTLIRTIPFLRKEIKTQFEILPQIASKADLLIGSSLVSALPSIAEKKQIPYRYIAFTPQLLPSCEHPFPAFNYHRLPRWGNRLTWRLANFIDLFNNIPLINHYRRQMDLAPIRDIWRHILGRHVIVASDHAIAKVPEDVQSPMYTQTGYMHLKQAGQTSNSLERFLANGPAPIYAGFGSMPKWDQMESVATIVEAARSVGQRVVIGKFWAEPSPFDLSEDIFFIGKYPHLDLFGRMAVIIHHGGAGTTASAAICGTPQIIVPHLLDQFYWGDQIHRAHLGPRPISRSKLKAPKLAQAIRQSLSDQRFRNNALKIAKEIKQSDSVQATAEVIIASL